MIRRRPRCSIVLYKEFSFYFESKGKMVKVFKRGRDTFIYVFLKDHSVALGGKWIQGDKSGYREILMSLFYLRKKDMMVVWIRTLIVRMERNRHILEIFVIWIH